MAFPTYKNGCDRRCVPMVSMVSMINSTSCQFTLSSTSRWHTADRIDDSFTSSYYAFGFFGNFGTASGPFANFLALCPKLAPCPEAAAQATTAAAAADQAADPRKAFPKTLRAWFSLAAIFTRFEQGANEVQTGSEIKFWETDPKLQLQARARSQKRRQMASKRDRKETKGDKLGKQGGSDKFKQSTKMQTQTV